MELLADLGDLRLRTLTGADAALLVEATQAESGRALWGPHPAGPYSLEDARAALQAWDPRRHGQVSFGALQGEWLVAALGLMPSGPHSAELAYWVRPEQRRRGIALRTILTLTTWAHTTAEPGSATTPSMTPGMTASSGSTPTVPEVGVGRGRADHRRR